jgi:hypothetical protein
MEVIRRYVNGETNPSAGMADIRVVENLAKRTHSCRSGSRLGNGRVEIERNEPIVAAPRPIGANRSLDYRGGSEGVVGVGLALRSSEMAWKRDADSAGIAIGS